MFRPLKLAFIRSLTFKKYVEEFTIICNIQQYKNINLIVFAYTSFLLANLISFLLQWYFACTGYCCLLLGLCYVMQDLQFL
jgi:hypothetical protein